MNATTSTERTALAAAGHLRGFFNGAREIDDSAVVVRGTLPPWLRGSLLLNGPALWELPEGSYSHWFDGLAMLQRVHIAGDGVRYRSRFLRSEDYLASTSERRPTMAGFGTGDRPGLWRRIRGVFASRVTDNAAVVMSQVAGRWAAASETPRMVSFDPDTLETLGELAFDDHVRLHLMAAHGVTDAQGTYWNAGVEFGRHSTYKLFRVPPGSLRREVVASFTAKASGYLHGIALAPRHAVVWEPAWRAQALAFKFTGHSYMDNFRWQPQDGARIHAISLADGQVQSWAVPPFVAFHALQAYEDEGAVVLELAQYPDASVMQQLMLRPRRAGDALTAVPQLVRYHLRPGEASAAPELVGDDLELPQVHPSRWAAGRATVVWGAGNREAFLDSTVRLDLATGERRVWQRGGATQLEPLYVGRPGAQEENDGVLLVPTLQDGDAGTVVAVLDPATMQCVAELQLPQVAAFGFHAAWNPG
jgi:carotenoid cleavage dioxygenase-like enzyme